MPVIATEFESESELIISFVAVYFVVLCTKWENLQFISAERAVARGYSSGFNCENNFSNMTHLYFFFSLLFPLLSLSLSLSLNILHYFKRVIYCTHFTIFWFGSLVLRCNCNARGEGFPFSKPSSSF